MTRPHEPNCLDSLNPWGTQGTRIAAIYFTILPTLSISDRALLHYFAQTRLLGAPSTILISHARSIRTD